MLRPRQVAGLTGLARWLRRELVPLHAGWRVMTFYQRFEQVVALLLTFVIAVVIVLALLELGREVVHVVVGDPQRPTERVFQALFGQIMTLLIALEFKHSILRAAVRRESIVRVKTILLIAMLVLARKFIVLDANAVPAGTILALAAVILALGVTYWLLRDRAEDQPRQDEEASAIGRAMAAARRRVERLERLERLHAKRRAAAGPPHSAAA